MFKQPNCPKCGKVILSVEAIPMKASLGLQKKLNGVAYACPHCAALLSFETDPLALKSDTLSGVEQLLKKHTSDLETDLTREIRAAESRLESKLRR